MDASRHQMFNDHAEILIEFFLVREQVLHRYLRLKRYSMCIAIGR